MVEIKAHPAAIRQSLNLNGLVLMLARRQQDWFEVKFQPNARCTLHGKRRLLIKGYRQASDAFDLIADMTEVIHRPTT